MFLGAARAAVEWIGEWLRVWRGAESGNRNDRHCSDGQSPLVPRICGPADLHVCRRSAHPFAGYPCRSPRVGRRPGLEWPVEVVVTIAASALAICLPTGAWGADPADSPWPRRRLPGPLGNPADRWNVRLPSCHSQVPKPQHLVVSRCLQPPYLGRGLPSVEIRHGHVDRLRTPCGRRVDRPIDLVHAALRGHRKRPCRGSCAASLERAFYSTTERGGRTSCGAARFVARGTERMPRRRRRRLRTALLPAATAGRGPWHRADAPGGAAGDSGPPCCTRPSLVTAYFPRFTDGGGAKSDGGTRGPAFGLSGARVSRSEAPSERGCGALAPRRVARTRLVGRTFRIAPPPSVSRRNQTPRRFPTGRPTQ